MADPLITIRDVRATGHCVLGAKRWCSLNGISFRALIGKGVLASELLATGDALAQQVVEHKMKQDRDHGE